MKKYISMIVASLVVFLYIINYNSIFNYEQIKNENYIKPYAEDLSVLGEGYVQEKEYDTRPSIKDLLITSGNVGGSNIQFNKPDEFTDLTEDENQTIFFFGRLDPSKPVSLEERNNLDEWDEWGYEGDTSTTPPSDFNDEEGLEIILEPLEVTLDQFLQK